MSFRNNCPTRRTSPKAVTKYQHYKPELRVDFEKRCGYCDDIDHWRDSFYEIDHFVPRDYWVLIKETDYVNLVYACRYCNNSKRAKWPTANETLPNNGTEGFVDPCDPLYDSHFERDNFGVIVPKTDLGIWMCKELKLYLLRHSIIWLLEKVEENIEEINSMNIAMDSTLKDKLLELYRSFHKYIKILRD